MLELHMANGMDLSDLEKVYGEKRPFAAYRVEWSREIQEFSVADKTKNILLWSKKTTGGSALWLPFTPGAINYAISRGKDVISGPFSGCLMAAYQKREGGGRRVCHVATSGDKMDCKEKWAGIKAECSSYVEFKPSLIYDKYTSKKQRKQIASTILFGLITADNRCFSALVRRDNKFTGLKIKKMEPTDRLGK